MNGRHSQSDSPEDASGSPHNLNGLKDRVGATFKSNSPMVNNPATGAGSKGNPGKPT